MWLLFLFISLQNNIILKSYGNISEDFQLITRVNEPFLWKVSRTTNIYFYLSVTKTIDISFNL